MSSLCLIKCIPFQIESFLFDHIRSKSILFCSYWIQPVPFLITSVHIDSNKLASSPNPIARCLFSSLTNQILLLNSNPIHMVWLPLSSYPYHLRSGPLKTLPILGTSSLLPSICNLIKQFKLESRHVLFWLLLSTPHLVILTFSFPNSYS